MLKALVKRLAHQAFVQLPMPSIQIQIQELSLQEKIRIRLFNNHLSHESLNPAKVEVIYAEYDLFFFQGNGEIGETNCFLTDINARTKSWTIFFFFFF